MSERILKALMQLFAIIAKVDGVTSSSRAIVQAFLKGLLNQELTEQYAQQVIQKTRSELAASKKKNRSRRGSSSPNRRKSNN